jgi:hypothetical protein
LIRGSPKGHLFGHRHLVGVGPFFFVCVVGHQLFVYVLQYTSIELACVLKGNLKNEERVLMAHTCDRDEQMRLHLSLLQT